MRSEDKSGKERSQAEQLNWERAWDERECIWKEQNTEATGNVRIHRTMTHINLQSLTSDTCLLRPPLVLKVLLQ